MKLFVLVTQQIFEFFQISKINQGFNTVLVVIVVYLVLLHDWVDLQKVNLKIVFEFNGVGYKTIYYVVSEA